MKNIKKIGALLLALVMVLAISATALAATNLGDGTATGNNEDGLGEEGVFASKDQPASVGKTLILEKELKVYNVDEATIKAPTISYKYSISGATVASGTTVTDSDKSGSIHESGVTVTMPVTQGPTTTVQNVTYPLIANNGVVAWTAADDTVNAGTDGVKNVKYISIDFSKVAFQSTGIYRYVILELLNAASPLDPTDPARTDAIANYYDSTGVTASTGNKMRYIDVYVKPSDAFEPLNTTVDLSDPAYKAEYVPEDWDIYGFTCFYNNESITEADKGTVAVKTTGFVDGTTGGSSSTNILADQYYTFNLTISKNVVNDGYGAATVNFPFTVLFTNNKVSTGTIVTNGASTTGTDFTHNTSVNLTTGDLKGVATLKSGQQIKYVGIPCGTSVEVYETNVATGVTYKVDTSVDGTDVTDNAVSWHDAPGSAVAQAAIKEAYQSTKTTITTTLNSDDDIAHSIAITNTLLTISPTGVTLRIAPFALMLAIGIFFLVLIRRNRREEADEI